MASKSSDASDPASLAALIQQRHEGRDLLLLLDYDGTLVPLVEDPDSASPDPELLELLAALAALPRAQVHVVSGRTRAILDRWLGDLPLGLHAEHGAYSRASDGRWTTHWTGAFTEALGQVRAVVERYVIDGARLEEKEQGLTWHYRAMAPAAGVRLAAALENELRSTLAGTELAVMHGSRIVEVRPRAVTKHGLVQSLIAASPLALAVALGDDRTDEDMFAALRDDDVAIHVGEGVSRAEWSVASVADVRAMLRALARPVERRNSPS